MKCAKTAFLHLNVTVDQYASQILQSCGHKEAKGSKNKKGGGGGGGDGKRSRRAVGHCLTEDPSLKASSDLRSPGRSLSHGLPVLTVQTTLFGLLSGGAPSLDQHGDGSGSHGRPFTRLLNHSIRVEVAF